MRTVRWASSVCPTRRSAAFRSRTGARGFNPVPPETLVYPVDIGGYGTKAYKCLQPNASRYGFVNDVKGELWHRTYRGPRL